MGAIVVFVLPMLFIYWKHNKKNTLIEIAKKEKISINSKIIENRYNTKLWIKQWFDKEIREQLVKEKQELNTKISQERYKEIVTTALNNINVKNNKLLKEHIAKEKELVKEKQLAKAK
jgi:hypothetical protein